MPGVQILRKGQQMSTNKAPSDGVYTLDGGRFMIRAGDTLPPGATFAVKSERAPKQQEPRKTATPPGSIDAEATAKALVDAGYYMIKLDELPEAIEGEAVAFTFDGQGEALAESLRAAGYELKPAKPKGSKDGATGPTETTQSTGPAETA